MEVPGREVQPRQVLKGDVKGQGYETRGWGFVWVGGGVGGEGFEVCDGLLSCLGMREEVDWLAGFFGSV